MAIMVFNSKYDYGQTAPVNLFWFLKSILRYITCGFSAPDVKNEDYRVGLLLPVIKDVHNLVFSSSVLQPLDPTEIFGVTVL